MKNLTSYLSCLTLFLLLSCKAMNKSSVTASNIPTDIGTKGYKVLFSELDFSNTVSRSVSDIHNNSAEKYMDKSFKGDGIFIKVGEENNPQYSDTKVYRYILKNRIGYEI